MFTTSIGYYLSMSVEGALFISLISRRRRPWHTAAIRAYAQWYADTGTQVPQLRVLPTKSVHTPCVFGRGMQDVQGHALNAI